MEFSIIANYIVSAMLVCSAAKGAYVKIVNREGKTTLEQTY